VIGVHAPLVDAVALHAGFRLSESLCQSLIGWTSVNANDSRDRIGG
jgi:hypothetical protein